jgi:hypothetical protein
MNDLIFIKKLIHWDRKTKNDTFLFQINKIVLLLISIILR